MAGKSRTSKVPAFAASAASDDQSAVEDSPEAAVPLRSSGDTGASVFPPTDLAADADDAKRAGASSDITEGLGLSSGRSSVWATWSEQELADELRTWQITANLSESHGLDRRSMLKLLDDLELARLSNSLKRFGEDLVITDYAELNDSEEESPNA